MYHLQYRDTRYLLCPEDFPVKFLEKFIRTKFNLDVTFKVRDGAFERRFQST